MQKTEYTDQQQEAHYERAALSGFLQRALSVTIDREMRRLAQTLATVLTVSLSSSVQAASCVFPPAHLTPPPQTRAVFILDTSGSMRGVGAGHANIFTGVKSKIAEYVAQAQPNQVELVTFDSGLKTRHSYQLPADNEALQKDLQALQANGNNTYLYRSLSAALAPLEGREQYVTNVFVLTDGIDNDPRTSATPATALASFTGRGGLDRLLYVALGAPIPPSAARALENSDYASGLSLPVGHLPSLYELAGVRTLSSKGGRVSLPFPDGTPVDISPEANLELTTPVVTEGTVRLYNKGAAVTALLCAAPPQGGGKWVAPRPRLSVVEVAPAERLQYDPYTTDGLILLNPAAPVILAAEQSTTFIYRAPTSERLSLRPLPTGVTGELRQVAGGRIWHVTIHHQASAIERRLVPEIQTAAGDVWTLPEITLREGGRAVAVVPATPSPSLPVVTSAKPVMVDSGSQTTPNNTIETNDKTTGMWLLLGLLLVGGLGAVAFWGWRKGWWLGLLPHVRGLLVRMSALFSGLLAKIKSGKKSEKKTNHQATQKADKQTSVPLSEEDLLETDLLETDFAPPTTPVAEPSVTPAAVSFADQPTPNSTTTPLQDALHLEYTPKGHLSLVLATGERQNYELDSEEKDVGKVLKLPLLEGLRVLQSADGLVLVNIPAGLRVWWLSAAQSAPEPLYASDTVFPATRLAVTWHKESRLGSLEGLGWPLVLRVTGRELSISGAYGVHSLTLPEGTSDVGELLSAEVLTGFKLSTLMVPNEEGVLSERILLVSLPRGEVLVHRPHERVSLRAGTYLPSEVNLTLWNS